MPRITLGEGNDMKMLCPTKHDQWKCSEGYDQAYENLVLTSADKHETKNSEPAERGTICQFA